MKTLLLLRHGKSSWEDPEEEDHERPLKPRGEKAAKQVGRWLRDSGLKIDQALCSSAVRARDTWLHAADQLKKLPPVEYLDELYHATPKQFVTVLHRLPPKLKTVLIVGHNPGLEDLLAGLRSEREAFPTAALAHLECPIKEWTEFEVDLPCTLKTLLRTRDLEKD